MSAYVVSKPTIERILSWLNRNQTRSVDLHVRGPLCEAADVENPQDLDALGRALWRMNVEAVMQRYPDTRDGTDLPGPIDFSPFEIEAATFDLLMPDSDGQIYQSICCLLYQCSEGGVPDWPLYIALREMKMWLAVNLAGQHPDVVSSEWE